jgi:ParB/RepB/Spo0J family partition protein
MIEFLWVSTDDLRPNPWNPNRMDEDMFEKAVTSIREFGFVDPITTRTISDGEYEIVDGEHRWVAAKQEGLTNIPIVDLGQIPDEIAQQLTIVLNETRGQADPQRLGRLLLDLSRKVDKDKLISTLPYSREAFDRLSGLKTLDLSSLESQTRQAAANQWVERIYRMPKDAAEVLDSAIQTWRSVEGEAPDWKVLEMLAADYLAS